MATAIITVARRRVTGNILAGATTRMAITMVMAMIATTGMGEVMGIMIGTAADSTGFGGGKLGGICAGQIGIGRHGAVTRKTHKSTGSWPRCLMP